MQPGCLHYRIVRDTWHWRSRPTVMNTLQTALLTGALWSGINTTGLKTSAAADSGRLNFQTGVFEFQIEGFGFRFGLQPEHNR